MGFELIGFLGRSSALRAWESLLASAVACDLGGGLGMVPLTGALTAELRARLGEKDAEGAARRWAREASSNTAIGYFDIGEFGNQSHEEARLWADGREILSRIGVRHILEYLRDREHLDVVITPDDLEIYRGETAAEKWVAAELQRRP